jgi:hypothetical protein
MIAAIASLMNHFGGWVIKSDPDDLELTSADD